MRSAINKRKLLAAAIDDLFHPNERTDGWMDAQREMKGQLAARCPINITTIQHS